MNEKTQAEAVVDHIKNCMTDVDAVVVAQSGQIDVPADWVYQRTEYVAGKRIRVFKLPRATE